MKKLKYFDSYTTCIRPYYFIIFDWDKTLIANVFLVLDDGNMDCIILVATNAYSMSINNLNIKLVIHWDFPIIFDTIIQ